MKMNELQLHMVTEMNLRNSMLKEKKQVTDDYLLNIIFKAQKQIRVI